MGKRTENLTADIRKKVWLQPPNQVHTRGTTIARVRRDSLPHSFGKKKGRVMADDQEILR
jgi:hypothetical protein